MSRATSWSVVILLATALLALFRYFAPLEPSSLAVWTGITLAVAGAISILIPLRILAIRSRGTGALVLLAGLAIATAGLFWPAQRTTTSAPRTQLDAILPNYDFAEIHSSRVHAPPEAVKTAIWNVTFGDIPAFDVLGRIRALAYGRVVRGGDPLRDVKLMEQFRSPDSAFFQLHEDQREWVGGMVGRPWANQGAPKPRDLAEFTAFNAPDSIKVAFNLLVEDEGNGWSRISTETRILSTDDSARRTMARYWRLIYPGSGLIRRMWLDAARKRAETPRV